jgi:hypothetical protein
MHRSTPTPLYSAWLSTGTANLLYDTLVGKFESEISNNIGQIRNSLEVEDHLGI